MMALSKKLKLVQITQTAARSQATFAEDVKQEKGKPGGAPGFVINAISTDPKDLAGLVIDKVYTITIS